MAVSAGDGGPEVQAMGLVDEVEFFEVDVLVFFPGEEVNVLGHETEGGVRFAVGGVGAAVVRGGYGCGCGSSCWDVGFWEDGFVECLRSLERRGFAGAVVHRFGGTSGWREGREWLLGSPGSRLMRWRWG